MKTIALLLLSVISSQQLVSCQTEAGPEDPSCGTDAETQCNSLRNLKADCHCNNVDDWTCTLLNQHTEQCNNDQKNACQAFCDFGGVTCNQDVCDRWAPPLQ